MSAESTERRLGCGHLTALPLQQKPTPCEQASERTSLAVPPNFGVSVYRAPSASHLSILDDKRFQAASRCFDHRFFNAPSAYWSRIPFIAGRLRICLSSVIVRMVGQTGGLDRPHIPTSFQVRETHRPCDGLLHKPYGISAGMRNATDKASGPNRQATASYRQITSWTPNIARACFAYTLPVLQLALAICTYLSDGCKLRTSERNTFVESAPAQLECLTAIATSKF